MAIQQVLNKKTAAAIAQAGNGSYSPNAGDVLSHIVWDTAFFANTTVRRNTVFFATGINQPYLGGATAGNKTEIETNMQDTGKFPFGQSFVAEEMSINLNAGIAGADTDVNTVLSAFTNIIQWSKFELKITGREFDTQLPGAKFMPALAAFALASAANYAPGPGQHLASGRIKLDTPVTIEGQATFSVLWTVDSGNSSVKTRLDTASGVLFTQEAAIQVALHGTLLRRK